MSTAATLGIVAWVVAEPGEPVADVVAALVELGVQVQLVSAGALGSPPAPPALAVVVGSGERACAQAARALRRLAAQPRMRSLPVVVVMPERAASLGDDELHRYELILRPLRGGELLARIDRATAAAGRAVPLDVSLRAGPLQLDPRCRRALIGERAVSLSAREFALLHYLARNPARVHSRAQILRAVWHDDCTARSRLVDVQVRRVRAKLGDELSGCIRTVRSVGYAFELPR